MQSSTARDIIANNKADYAYNTNSAGMFRNPMYDIRTQQELAGELDPTALYPNPITDTVYPNDPTPDPYACGLGETYDPYLQQCVPIVPDLDNSNDREVQEEPYQGVGSVYSPTQNAFMNLGLGDGSTFEDVKSYYGSGEISKSGFGFDSFNQGLKSILGMTPLGIPGRIGRNQDIDFLVKSGIINRGSNGNLTFAKGGNLNLVQANQAFEQDLARQQGLNLDAVGANPLVYEDSLGNTFSQPYQQSRGDKADNMSNNVYKDNNANVNINPFKSDYGATEIISYKTKPNKAR